MYSEPFRFVNSDEQGLWLRVFETKLQGNDPRTAALAADCAVELYRVRMYYSDYETRI